MRFSTFIATTFALLATPVLSAPLTSLVQIEKFDGEVKQGSYIVKLKNNVSKADCLNWLTPHLGSDSLTHTDWQKGVLNGFAGRSSRVDSEYLLTDTNTRHFLRRYATSASLES